MPAFSIVDLSPFPNVVTIGDNFLNKTNIMYLDMTCFNYQEDMKIGQNFVSMCDYLIYANMGDIKASNVNCNDASGDRSFSAFCNLTALSVVVGISINGSNCSQYISRFENGMYGSSLEDLWIRNVKILDLTDLLNKILELLRYM